MTIYPEPKDYPPTNRQQPGLPKMRVCIFMPSFGDGGNERSLANLARGLAEQGVDIDFASGKVDGPYLAHLPESVARILIADVDHDGGVSDFTEYLRRRTPDIVLASKDKAYESAIKARERSGHNFVLTARPGTTVSAQLHGRRALKKWGLYRRLRAIYRQVDHVIAISHGVAGDIAAITGYPLDRIDIIRNPTITPELGDLAAQPVHHEWLTHRSTPVILGAGRLARSKDFATLIKATAVARKQHEARLIILGQGKRRKALQRLARRLGIQSYVDFAGFTDNPYAYMAASDLFVLSSRWEGQGNVLIEALSVGTSVISTDCRSGPREILGDNELGRLVPVGDYRSLGAAIADFLKRRPKADPQKLAAALHPFRLATSAQKYKQAFERLLAQRAPAGRSR